MYSIDQDVVPSSYVVPSFKNHSFRLLIISIQVSDHKCTDFPESGEIKGHKDTSPADWPNKELTRVGSNDMIL